MPTRRNQSYLAPYVNAYETTREYGGPEEGSWYFTTGDPLKSVRVYSVAQKDKAEAELREEYRYLERGLVIKFENHPGKPFPEVRPHYE